MGNRVGELSGKRRKSGGKELGEYKPGEEYKGMMDLTINEIAKACRGKLVLQGGTVNGDTCVSSVAIDSRQAEERGVFVAVPGERVDGHSFIASVYAKGAILAITQKTPEQCGCPADQWGSYLLVEDSLQALKDIAEVYRKKLDIKVVGITGSSGKTSTKELMAAVLSEKYHVLKTEGNLNNEIGVPLTLLRIRKEHEVAVVEMGISDFGEMHRLSRMARPNICVITNIGQSHLKDLKTRDGILKAKSEIFDFMAEDGEICLNGEDDKLSTLKEVKGHKPHFFGLGGNPEEEVVMTESVGRGLRGSDARALFRKGGVKLSGSRAGDGQQEGGSAQVSFPVHIPLPGGHMVLNAAAAACVAGLLGLTGEEIAAGLAGASPVKGRDNIMYLPRYTLIDGCYNANPASMKAAVDLLAMADTPKVAILGDMFNLGENSKAYHGQMGAYAAEQGIDLILCVGGESKEMYLEAERKIEEARGSRKRQQKTLYFPDRQALMEALAGDTEELAPEGSTILVKASHGMEFNRVLDFLQAQP